MNIIEALNRLRSDIQTWTANNLKTKVNADDLSTSVTTGTLSANQIFINGDDVKNLLDALSNKNNAQDATISTLATKEDLNKKLDSTSASETYVPKTRKINGVALDKDITITATDPNAATKDELNALDATVTNLTTDSVKEGTNKYFTNERAVSALSGTLNNYIPNTRKINNKVLSNDITLSVSDISGAVSTDTFNALDSSLATVAKSGSYNDLTNKPTIPSEVTETTVSGWGYMKKTAADSVYADKNLENTVSSLQEQFDNLTAIGGEPNVQSDWNVTNDTLDSFIKNKPDLSVYETKENAKKYALKDTVTALDNSLHEVAKSGDYTKLKNLPTIPSAVTDSTVSGWGYLKTSDANSKYAQIGLSDTVTSLLATVSNKVDKVSGKGLSEADFTNAEKTKLSELVNYNDAGIKSDLAKKASQDSLNALSNRVDALSDIVGGESGGSNNLVQDIADLKTLIDTNASNKNKVWKADGTGKPGWRTDETGKDWTSDISTINNNISSLQSQFDNLTAIGGEPNVQADWNTTNTNDDSYIKNKPDLSIYETKNHASNTYALSNTVSSLDASLHEVAKSGDYTKLKNLPTIPSAVTSSTISNWGYLKTSDADNKYAPIALSNTVDTFQEKLNQIVSAGSIPSDWNAKENEVGHILNKPDLTVYETKANAANTYAPKSLSDTVSQLSASIPSGIIATDSGSNENKATSNPYVKLNNKDGKIQIKGSGTVSVSSTANGIITIHSDGVEIPNVDLSDYALKADLTSHITVAENTYAKKSELPTVNNATLTIQKNGTNIGTFTANQSDDTTVNISIPTSISDLSGYDSYATIAFVNQQIEGIVSGDVEITAGISDVQVLNASGKYDSVVGEDKIAKLDVSGCTESGHYMPSSENTNNKQSANTNNYISAIKLDSKKHVIGIEQGALPTFTESYKGTVTKISTGSGLTGGDITTSGTIKCNLNSYTSLGTIGTTEKLYAVGVDKNNQLCVNIPWSDTDESTTYAGHYTPNGTSKSGTASGSTLSFGGAVVTGLTYDGKGHVTGFTTSKLPSDPNTNTTYTLATGDSNGQIKVTPSSGSAYNVSVKGLGSLAYKSSLAASDVGLGNVDNLAASGYLTVLSSDTTNAVSITVGGTTKNITAATMKTSLGLKSLAYKDSLSASDIPSLTKSKISDFPTIPAEVTETTVSNWGFTKNTGTYSKPSTGIPKTDLASAVRTSLDKADTVDDLTELVNDINADVSSWTQSPAKNITSTDIDNWNNKSNLTLGTTSTTALKGDTKYAGSSTAGGSATSAVKLDTSTAGSAAQPCYFINGKPSACTHELRKTVPETAVFTDVSVKMTSYSTSANLPLLCATTASPSSGSVYGTYYNTGVYANLNTKYVYAAGFFQTSDERLKNFQGSIPVDLDKLGTLRKEYYTWKDGENKATQIGVSAQEIQNLYPELVSEDTETGRLTVAYDKLSVIALAAVDKLNEQNKILENRIEKLEKLLEQYGKNTY